MRGVGSAGVLAKAGRLGWLRQVVKSIGEEQMIVTNKRQESRDYLAEVAECGSGGVRGMVEAE